MRNFFKWLLITYAAALLGGGAGYLIGQAIEKWVL